MSRPNDVPPGWPGDDPTVPEDLARLGARARTVRGRHRRPLPRSHTDTGPVTSVTDPDVVDPDGDLDARLADDLDLDTGLAEDPDSDPGHDARADRRPARRRPRRGPAAEADDRVAGIQPAGRALVVMVAALVLAMLVNADALVARAEQQPLGPKRDRALAVWHPVQDVSHVLQLHRVRQVADWLAGNDDDHRGGPVAPAADGERSSAGDDATTTPTTAPTSAETTTPTTAPAPSELRTPTASDPLRLWVVGDSQAQTLGGALTEQAGSSGVMTAGVHFENSSGLVRPDFYDWPGALTDDVAAHDPEVVVVFLGANDGQGIVLPDGTAVQTVDDPRWAVEYQRRVGAVMDSLRADGRTVVWVGQPPMRGAEFDGIMKHVNAAYVAEAASRPWVAYVDPATIVGGPGGAYADLVADPAGNPTAVRSTDGIHLSRAGADLVSAQILAQVRQRAGLPPA
jgi:hypothetical protein